MNWDELGALLVQAWGELVEGEAHLLIEEANEPTVSAMLACYLRPIFQPHHYRVDVEYNKMNSAEGGRRAKRVKLGQDGLIYPDIVIHRHAGDALEENLLVIELKKFGNTAYPHDEVKLTELTRPPNAVRPFQYRFGLLIRYHEDGTKSATRFHNGQHASIDGATFLTN